MKLRAPRPETVPKEDGAPEPTESHAPGRRGREKSRRGTLLKVSMSAALVLWILRGTSVTEILGAIRTASLPLVLLAFSLYLVGWAISVTRWRILLAAQHVRAPAGFLLRSYLVAVFFNNLLPSTIGGDTVRAYDSWRLGHSKADAVAVIFVDRFMGMLSLFLFALAATLGMRWLSGPLPLLPLWMGTGAGGLLLLTWALFMPSPRFSNTFARLPFPLPDAVRRKLARAAAAMAVFRADRAALGKALGLSLVLQANVILHYWLIALALGLEVPMLAFFLVVPLALAVMAIPVSVNAIGVRESAFAFFLGMFGVATVEAVAFAWVAYGLVLVQGLVGGLVYAFRR
jgi:glycosyltransferase 2 family protein